MYRLLIVDDEVIIADGLFEVFGNLKNLDLDVYKAYSGKKALELLEKTRIDIVLTDIRMPGIDGLQLLDRIHGSWPKCKVIFLTGYDEFDYVYKAIQFEGVSYILKTEGYGKVIGAVEKATAEIEKGLKAEELLKNAKEQLGTMSQLLQKEYLSSILKGEFSLMDTNQQQINELGIPLRIEEPVLILIGHIDDMNKTISYSEKSRQFYSINLIAAQYLSSHIFSVHLVCENTNLVWIIQPNKDKLKADDGIEALWARMVTFIKGSLEMVQAACKETLGISVSFALNDKPAEWEDIADRYSFLKMLLNYRIGQGSGMLVTDKSMDEKDLQQLTDNKNEKLHGRQSKLELLTEYLEHGKKEDFTGVFKELTENLINIKSIHDTNAQELYYSISLIFLSYINRWNLIEKIAFKTGIHKLMQVEEHGDWRNAVEYLKALGEILFEIQDSEQEQRAQKAVSRIQNYINDNINDELSLVKLADLVYFNPSYLSRLFKQVEGINLSDYICAARIKRAKRLLENPDMKIHDIAESVGYYSSTNFARFFRKMTGMTPQEYRDSQNK